MAEQEEGIPSFVLELVSYGVWVRSRRDTNQGLEQVNHTPFGHINEHCVERMPIRPLASLLMRLVGSAASSDEVANTERQVQGHQLRKVSLAGLGSGEFRVRCILVTIFELAGGSYP